MIVLEFCRLYLVGRAIASYVWTIGYTGKFPLNRIDRLNMGFHILSVRCEIGQVDLYLGHQNLDAIALPGWRRYE